MDIWLGILFLALAVWQFAVTWRHFHFLKAKGNQNTSPFAMVSLWFSFVFGVLMVSMAVMTFGGVF